jgi:UDP-N-acetyl-D-galactosamine dehydrogenase
MIFAKLGIDSSDVLEAAGTKWNFLKFRPGLVGGHCIGVDPYYLTHKAETIGYHPQVILAGRRINDGMAKFVAEQTVKVMTSIGKPIVGSRVLVLGLTFKENCGDLRNSKVADVIRELSSYNMDVIVTDPLAHPEEAHSEYGVDLVPWDEVPNVDAIVAAVPHEQFVSLKPEELLGKFSGPGVFVDVKSAFDANVFSAAGHAFWRL